MGILSPDQATEPKAKAEIEKILKDDEKGGTARPRG